jgi:hypothetical protein
MASISIINGHEFAALPGYWAWCWLGCDDSNGYTHMFTPETLNRLGDGGRIVIVVGTAESSGTYFVRVSR